MGCSEAENVSFGNPSFGREVYAAFGTELNAIRNMETLMNDIFSAANLNATEPVQKIVHYLAILTADSLRDVVTLAGHGSGPGAMKIARGMFETAVVAEYLRRNPDEAENFREYHYIQNWRRYQKLLSSSPERAKEIRPERVKELQDDYNRVVPRFTNRKGQIRNQWSKKSIAQMAEEIGRADQYETPYSLAASIHHGSFEGIAVHVSMEGDSMSLCERPSLAWVAQALVSAHVYILQVLDTLNDSLHGGFDERIKAATEEFQRVWKNEKSA